ncbi:MAG: NAD-dependent succinate-semialdehyde dehydrogenase [Spirochaetia bacterium]|nr:NAD-dependent succinate-semialdehyde dehydrogenase [Spirochaetia bacterium]
MSFVSINPKNEEIFFEAREYTNEQIKEIIETSNKSQLRWKEFSIDKKADLFKNIAILLNKKEDLYAKLITDEMGKPIVQASAEIKKCAWLCEYYANHAKQFLCELPIETDYKKATVYFEPLGVILGIMPWNFPFWQVFRFSVPAMLAGNGAILKHSPNVSMCALEIEKLFVEAQFPEKLFSTVLASIESTSLIIENKHIQGVSLTGGTIAGKAVAALAGKSLKKTVLELGGLDPYIIMEDADIEKSAESCIAGRLLNAGQSCIAAKRFIVHEKIYDKFVELFAEKMKSKTLGDPLENCDLGPLAREDLRDNIHGLVEKSVSMGAKLVTGGKIPDMKGYYYPPTLLADIQRNMPVWQEETFGPAAAVVKYKTEEEAVLLANDTVYGLGAAIFSRDIERAERIAVKQINAGNCFINDFVKSDPKLPFGGVKESGYGRELSTFGIREFVNIKTVVVN